MTFSPCPKPAQSTESEKRVDRLVKAWARNDRWRAKAIAKAKGKPRSKVKQRNEKRIARKYKAYRTVIASAFHKSLRYVAYLRSKGYCECGRCVGYRNGTIRGTNSAGMAEWGHAHTLIPCWFTVRGNKDFLRFRSSDGELHHRTYKYFGDENWAEVDHVQWVWKSCHQRIEAEHSTRRRFLTGQ